MNKNNSFLSLHQNVFVGLMVTADFAIGLILKNILAPTHILNIIRIDMLIPIMLMFITRQIINKFGVLILYEFIWGLFSVFAMPSAFGLPGLLKIIPAVLQGLVLDTLMSAFNKNYKIKFYVTAVFGSFLSTLILFALKVALGMPWNDMIKIMFSINLVANTIVWIFSAYVSLIVLDRIKSNALVRSLSVEK